MQNDFFYFSRGQRKAVIVLIALIVVLTGLLFWKDKYIQNSKPEEILVYKQETESFLQQLKTDSIKSRTRTSSPKKKQDIQTTGKARQKIILQKDTMYQIESVPRLKE